MHADRRGPCARGLRAEEKARLVRALTDAVRFVVPAPDEAITVMLSEYPAENYAAAGMEARDLDTRAAMLGEGFAMTFPGTGPMTSLAELIDWAKGRYRFVTKTYEAVEAFQPRARRRLHARDAGRRMAGRHAVRGHPLHRPVRGDGRVLTRQDVWNDMAEVRGAR
jgi:phenylpyruvate tautomerase PptA (4-oxalocrotonate tautomerase family)